MVKMNIVGMPFSLTGYGVHTFHCAKALINLGVDLGIQSQMSQFSPDMDSQIVEACKKMHENAPTEIILTPDNWWFKLADRLKLFGYLVFEGTKIPLSWAKACEQEEILEIWCPSNHVKKAIRNGGVDKNVRIIPHGVDEKIFNQSVVKRPEFDDGYFRFLFVGGWRQGILDRKGLHFLLAAFKDEFKRDEKVELIVKVNMAYGGNPVEEINKLNLSKDGANIQLITEQMPTEVLATLYASCDCFVMPTRGEAFCMPIAEAMACGLPVIATKFGGQEDFMKYGTLIDGELKPACTKELEYERAEWMDIDTDKLKQSMREHFQNPEKSKLLGKKNSKYILKNYKWSDCAKRIIKRIEAI